MYAPLIKQLEYGEPTASTIGILFRGKNHALFNENEQLIQIICHPQDKPSCEFYVRKNLDEFLDKVRVIQRGSFRYTAMDDIA